MSWNSLQDFLAMGGYGVYVWGSCGVTLAALVLETWLARRRLRHARRVIADARRPA
ncbi:heme exporter protein CcmD [Pseudoduganella sp. SL102]|uniref:heme exporter protein CcmD n=1 Tax=Pseudoduganella sp. SL102 TaxID=2995154 RepID=UPI00248B6031|nr:heme exporter protein CcmD [Pseudoduganella sp. SL102]WBS00974.1 heme exporter protein CcmD [Pseudoduganella sp. SL102]